MGKVRITQVKSSIDRSADQKRTLVALGLKKMQQTKEIDLNPQLSGMIKKVEHLLKVEQL